MPPAGYPNNLRSGYVTPRLFYTGSGTAVASTDGADTSPGATTTIYSCELIAPTSFVTTGVALFNGSATGSASVSIALFDRSGGIVVSAPTTALSGTDAYQRIAWTKEFLSVPGTATTIVSPQLLPPGTYFVSTIYSTTTTVKANLWAGVGNHGQGTSAGTYATAFSTTNLTIVPPTTYTTAEGNIASLY